MNPALINAVGVAAALCSMSSFLPQLLKIRREKSADDVSLKMFAVAATGFCLWAVYGLAQQAWPLVGSNLVCLALCIAIMALKLRYDGGRTKRAAG
jgi:MtN3 and saliva related transmembrane protein